MKHSSVAKISGYSKSYVSKVSARLITNEQVAGLLALSEQDFSLHFLENPLMEEAMETAMMYSKIKDVKIFAVKILEMSRKLRKP